MRENRSYGSVRGAARKSGPYRDRRLLHSVNDFARYCCDEPYVPSVRDCLLHIRSVVVC